MKKRLLRWFDQSAVMLSGPFPAIVLAGRGVDTRVWRLMPRSAGPQSPSTATYTENAQAHQYRSRNLNRHDRDFHSQCSILPTAHVRRRLEDNIEAYQRACSAHTSYVLGRRPITPLCFAPQAEAAVCRLQARTSGRLHRISPALVMLRGTAGSGTAISLCRNAKACRRLE